MALRRITKAWIVALVIGVLAAVFLRSSDNGAASCLAGIGLATAVVSFLALASIAFLAMFRAIVRRLSLRLAFSYFLIGVLPIPLLALVLFAFGYLTAQQIVGTRVRREVSTIGIEALARQGGIENGARAGGIEHGALAGQSTSSETPDSGARPGERFPAFRIAPDGTVTESEIPWLAVGSSAAWAKALSEPRPLIVGDDAWLAVPVHGAQGGFLALQLTEPSGRWARRLSELTGYDVSIETGRSGHGRGFNIDVSDDDKPERSGRSDKSDKTGSAGKADKEKPGRTPAPASPSTSTSARRAARRAASPLSPRPTPPPSAATAPPGTAGQKGPAKPPPFLDQKWIAGVYLDKPVAEIAPGERRVNLVIFLGQTSPRLLFRQLFAQGIPEIGRVFWVVVVSLSLALLLVYLVALGIAFTLVGSIARNVNRLTRASQAIARGDFSVRVNSKSRDQIGDLARSYDGMAASIQRLLLDTARKERLEAEIAVARTIQQKLLPPPDAKLTGLCLQAHFEPLAEIGGDYYDYMRTPDGRSAVAIGDVSGHGLSTGLLVAMAKAGLSTLLESGLEGTALFIRLNDLIYRSTDSRNYMTLALFAYDPATGRGTLTNAGQLAPYRLAGGKVESLSLPSFPLGASPRKDFPTREWQFHPGDRLVFSTDGIVEAANPSGEPFGFERLEALLFREAEASPREIQEAILAAVALYTDGAPAEDDRTLVIIQIEPVPVAIPESIPTV